MTEVVEMLTVPHVLGAAGVVVILYFGFELVSAIRRTLSSEAKAAAATTGITLDQVKLAVREGINGQIEGLRTEVKGYREEDRKTHAEMFRQLGDHRERIAKIEGKME